MCAIDGAGFDWSDMAEEEIQANMALMAFSDSEVTNDKSCLKNYEALKKQYDDLLVKLDDTGFKASTYKRGLSILEGQILKYKESEVLFSEEIALLKRSVGHKEYLMGLLRTELEKVKDKNGWRREGRKERYELEGRKRGEKKRRGLEEFKQPEVNELDKDWKEKFFCPANQVREEEPKKARENNDAPIIEDWVSDDEDDVEPIPKVEKKTVIPTATKKEFVKPKTPVRRSVSCPNVHKHMVPRAVLMKTGLKTVNTARPVNTVRARGFNAVKPSACWVWKPIKPNGASLVFNKYNYIDARADTKLKFNLFSVSQMCDKKNYVLFTDSECLVLSPNFKLPDENQILLKIPRQDNMYSFDMKNIVPKDGLTCLVAKATSWEFQCFGIEAFGHEQATQSLFLMHKKYCLVVTDDYSRFSWVFFLTTKDETSEILKNFIKEVENLVDKKVKIIRSDNGTEFKNKVMDDFCREKGIKREYSVARTPQQNGVAERKNRTLIEAARTMLADSKLPTTFWAEAVSTACYVQNRVLIVKPHNKTPYELFRGFKPAIGFMKPFGCHVTILNTLDNLGKFDEKSDEGFFVGYSLSSKAFRVYNIRTRKVQENLHIGFLENKPMIEGNGPKWLFDLDSLTQSMNYVPVVAGKSSNDFAEDKDVLHDEDDATEESHDGSNLKENEAMQEKLLQFKLQKVWILVDLPKGHRAIGTKWVYRNKKDERGIVIRNKARLVAQGYTQEEGIDYDEVFSPVARIVAIRMFLAYASYMGFMVYQMDVKSTFLYGQIEEEVYVCQPPGFEDPNHPDKVYKRKQLQQHSRTYHVPSLSIKVFNNMKRPTKGYSGQEVDLFPTMLNVSEPSTSPSRITSSPSYLPEPSHSHEPSIEHSPEPSIEHSPDHTTAVVSFPSPTQPTCKLLWTGSLDPKPTTRL
ncbi:retrovirus-related pol polyprotein from transposon TNT 1-94 [Tanacetum coccineum]|uniref:Retrovirus-related pol polyprotein from transposon TNT 1-94 n=1 Tax=Tanacetum coccineum TaxID=301880 RepID=A0ABQ4YDG0_9ASTR